MKIVIAHNRYQQRGGEDVVVEAELELLRRHLHEVLEYSRENHELLHIGHIATVQQTLWSTKTTREILKLITDFKPDILHVHNTFPLISPSIYWAASKRKIPVVQTLHNFRLLCPQALMLRNGRPCGDCVGKPPWRGVVHGCYRDSRPKSMVLASMIYGHRLLGTWRDHVTRYITLNDFCRDQFIAGGLPAEKIRVKPNFVDLPTTTADENLRRGFLFVGRLSMEKGIAVLISAARQSRLDEPVWAAGEGPELAAVTGEPAIQALGPLAAEAVYSHMTRARALVLPSIWYENFPRTIVEAFACSLPVIASRLGAMAAIVQDGVTGLLFSPGDANDLSEKMQWVIAHPKETAAMGRNARKMYEENLSADANYQCLLGIYLEAIRANRPNYPAELL